MRRVSNYLTAIILGITLLFVFVGCSTDSALAPEMTNSGLVVQSDTGPVTLLRMSTTKALSKGEAADFYAQTFVTAAAGGELVVGNAVLGYSKIIFQPNDLSQDLNISVTWGGSEYCDGIFGPHGTSFNNPVQVELSYKHADLTGVDEDDLKIYYYNESTSVWEFIGGSVDKDRKVIIGTLEHFSRYAIIKT